MSRSSRGNPRTVHAFDFVGRDNRDALHAKLAVVDRRVAVVGSANLTFWGLASSHEFAVRIEGPSVARIADQIETLTSSGYATRIE